MEYFCRFYPGPKVKAVYLTLQRAPIFLRLVVDATGTVDALDQPDDSPKPDEKIYTFVRVGDFGTVHVDRTVEGRRVGEWYKSAEYTCHSEQPPDEVMRDTGRWQEWTKAAYEKMRGTL